MKIKEVLDKTVKFFQEKNFESPRLEAELLLSHALKLDRIHLYVKFDQPLGEDELARARDLVRRRVGGEPVAYITGEKGFFGSVFKVGPGVLIPRPETEHLVEEAISWMEKQTKEDFCIVDLGTGSGCIGLSLLKAVPHAKLVAVDRSSKALEYFRLNSTALGLDERCLHICADAKDATEVLKKIEEHGFEKIDILVANPPYIDPSDPEVETSVKNFEPHEALFSSQRGLQDLQSWSQIYRPLMQTPGLMLMEMGYLQGPDMKKHFEKISFNNVEVKKDMAGHDRVIKGEIKIG